MNEPKYKIETINDLAKLAASLPPEKCSNLIKDISIFINSFGLIGLTLRTNNQKIPEKLIKTFTWIDDNKIEGIIKGE